MRWFATLLLVVYCGFVARLTLFDPSAGRPVFDAAYRWSELLSEGRLDVSQTEALANVVLFFPAGLLLAVALRRPLVSIACCVAASVCIELAQQLWLPSRVPTVADVEHNGVGAALGVLMAWALGIVRYPRLRLTHGSSAPRRAHPSDHVLVPDRDAAPALRR